MKSLLFLIKVFTGSKKEGKNIPFYKAFGIDLCKYHNIVTMFLSHMERGRLIWQSAL